MPQYVHYLVSAAVLSVGLIAMGVTFRVERRREREAMPYLLPAAPLMLFGMTSVLAAIIYFLSYLNSRYSQYLVAVASLSFGIVVVGIAVWIERRRLKTPRPYRSSTTPYLFFGAIVVLLAIKYFLDVLRG
jgi:hypothetical protein